jgi:hypothetical protein
MLWAGIDQAIGRDAVVKVSPETKRREIDPSGICK